MAVEPAHYKAGNSGPLSIVCMHCAELVRASVTSEEAADLRFYPGDEHVTTAKLELGVTEVSIWCLCAQFLPDDESFEVRW